jgi:acetylornithine deacetylase
VHIEEAIARVLTCVDEEEVVRFASELIGFPSLSGDENALTFWLKDFFDARGYEVDLQAVPPLQDNYQVIARLKGTGGGRDLMFNGHIDVDPLMLDCRDPWTAVREGNRLRGWGVWNMKAGTAALIMAAEAVRRSGIRLKGDIVVCPVVGELEGGRGTYHALRHGATADMAINAEPYSVDDIGTTTNGALVVRVSTKGTFGVDGAFAEGGIAGQVDALEKMLKIIPAVKQMTMTCVPWPKVPGTPFVYCGALRAGRGIDHSERSPYLNVDFCTATFHIFTVPGQTPDTVTQDIIDTIEQLRLDDQDINYEIDADPPEKVMPPMDLPHGSPIVEIVSNAYTRLTGNRVSSIGVADFMATGNGPVCPSDHSHINAFGIPCVNVGPDGGWVHEPGVDHYQYVNIDEMLFVTKLYAAAALDACGLDDEQRCR